MLPWYVPKYGIISHLGMELQASKRNFLTNLNYGWKNVNMKFMSDPLHNILTCTHSCSTLLSSTQPCQWVVCCRIVWVTCTSDPLHKLNGLHKPAVHYPAAHNPAALWCVAGLLSTTCTSDPLHKLTELHTTLQHTTKPQSSVVCFRAECRSVRLCKRLPVKWSWKQLTPKSQVPSVVIKLSAW